MTPAATDTAYQVGANVRLSNRKGVAPETHRVSFDVQPGASRVYVQPGMERGAAEYKGCTVELLGARPL